MKAALPARENERLDYLYHLAILDTPREQSFDDVAQLAGSICATPIAIVSMIDERRQWYKSCVGLDITEVPRELTFCAHAILNPDELMVVEDARQDPRFCDHPMVVGEPYIRFYAGAPLVTENGLALGTLCIVDFQPRGLSQTQILTLKLLAGQVMQLLRLREANNILAQERRIAQESEERLQTMVSNFPGAVYRCENNSRWSMLFMSAAVESLTGYPAAEFLRDDALSMTDITHSDDIPVIYDLVQEALVQRRSFHLIYRLQHADQSWRWVEEVGCGVFDEQGELKFIDGFIWDISERKRIEQMKNDFVSAVSHELRTPLTAISGSLGLIASGMLGELPSTIRNMVDIAHKNALRLTLLINDLLDMEKILAGKMEFNMVEQALLPILENSLESNKAYADTFGIRLALHAPEADLRVRVDAQRLQQVLANFISNAVKFSPAGGQVEVELSQQGEWAKIAVVDHGPGISDEFRARIFQKFSQADSSDSRQRGGTGLGLAISKSFVEKMQGKIGFDSELGKGATFFALFLIAGNPSSGRALPATDH